MAQPLPRPQLVVSNTLVAQALDHLQALQKIYNEMRQAELERARKACIIVRLPSAGEQQRMSRNRFAMLVE